MSNCYFIDFENVRNSGLSNLKGLDKDDLIFLFYTSDTDTITLNNIDLLNNSECRYELIKVPAGSQSLDRHLISFAGYAIGIHGNKFDYIIVSKDKGYDCIISFWKARCGISAKRQAAVNVNSAKKTPDGSKAVPASDVFLLYLGGGPGRGRDPGSIHRDIRPGRVKTAKKKSNKKGPSDLLPSDGPLGKFQQSHLRVLLIQFCNEQSM